MTDFDDMFSARKILIPEKKKKKDDDESDCDSLGQDAEGDDSDCRFVERVGVSNFGQSKMCMLPKFKNSNSACARILQQGVQKELSH